MRRAAAILVLLLCTEWPPPAVGQVIIYEVHYNPAGEDLGNEKLELKNVGAASVTMTGWELCSTLLYSGPGSFAGVVINPSQIIVVHLRAMGINDPNNVYLPNFPPMFPPAFPGTLRDDQDEISLYDCSQTGCFDGVGDNNRMIDYVQWGVTGQGMNQERHDIAADLTRPGGPLWSQAAVLDFAPVSAEGASIAFDGGNGGGGELTLGSDYVSGPPTIGLENTACTSNAQCNDGVPCTDDVCVAGQCVHTPNNALCPDDGVFCNGVPVCNSVSGCTAGANPCAVGLFCNETTDHCDACQTAAQCDDNDACTVDACGAGACSHTPLAGCCLVNDDCDDDNVCTADACVQAACIHVDVPDCVACAAATDCDDENPCTEALCVLGMCAHAENPAPCDDNDPCTGGDVCAAGACAGNVIPTCCQVDADCDDADPCTEDACGDNECKHVAITGCTPCEISTDCDDNDPCTDEACDEGVCAYTDNAAACDDGDACTSGDRCQAGVCAGTPVVGCCTQDTACDDADACTSDACTANVCVQTPIAGCGQPVEDDPPPADETPAADVPADDSPPPRRPARQSGLCGGLGALLLAAAFLGLGSLRGREPRPPRPA